tara:strand:+ start:926 stop:1360 length:435 start_codon:yes stop_codon:yes gene_type:complete
MPKKPVKKPVKKPITGRINQEKKNKENLLIALEKTLGNISISCKKVGISRTEFYNLKNGDSTFAKAVEGIKEIAIDFAESKLLENIKDNKESSIFFFLKTQAKHRGYVERTENINVEIDEFSNVTDDELRVAIQKSKTNVKGKD